MLKTIFHRRRKHTLWHIFDNGIEDVEGVMVVVLAGHHLLKHAQQRAHSAGILANGIAGLGDKCLHKPGQGGDVTCVWSKVRE